MNGPRVYNSPIRDEKARVTREAILEALLELMSQGGAADDVGMEAIAHKAGIQRRTIFRHFASKDELLQAFWIWLNARIGASTAPATVDDIVSGPRHAFPLFDAHEAAMRAAIHSKTGRDMRMGNVAGRRISFARALEPALHSVSRANAAKIEALAHLLFSASAWEVLKDYGGLTGAQAGETASWALDVILSAVTSGHAPADISSLDKEKSVEDRLEQPGDP